MAEEASMKTHPITVPRTALRTMDIVALLLLLYLLAGLVAQLSTKSSDYMTINKIYVPEHITGDNPQVIYDRTVHKSFIADWRVGVLELETGLLVCKGFGTGEYKKGDNLQDMSLSYYIGSRCDIKQGNYLLKTIWRLANNLEIRNTSNVFAVRGPAN